MNRWHIWLRNMARSVGVTRLLAWRQQWSAASLRRQYRRDRPTSVRLGEAAWSSDFLAGDEQEYVNLQQKRSDMEILRVLVHGLAPGDVCWDVGANIGLYSVVAARIVGSSGRVLAFEPEPRSRQRLVDNLELNRLTNVDVVALALGERMGTFTMLLGENASSGTHRLVQENSANPIDGSIEINVVSGDEYRRQHGLQPPALIKVDVEGAELDVLAGLRTTLSEPGCRSVLCEVHFAILHSRGQGDAPLRIQELLNRCGFSIIKWIDHSHLAAFK